MKDDLRGWLAPLMSEAQEQGINLSVELLIATKPPEGRLSGPMNWVLYGQLIIERLGWEDTYPDSPSSEHSPENT